MRRLLYVPAALLAAFLIGSAAYSMVDVAVQETTETTLDFATTDEVVLRNDGGGVRVIGDRAEGIRVVLRQRDGIQASSAGAHLDAEGRVVVSTRCPPVMTVVCKAEATVHVPKGTAVTGGSGGSVRVRDVGGPVDVSVGWGVVSVSGAEGPVRARSGGGRIEVFDSSGDLDLRSSNGSVTVDGTHANVVEASSSNGRVRLGFSNHPHRVNARSSNGSITVTLPGDAPPYAVSTSTSNGSTTTGVRTDPSAERSIVASTANGSITVAYR